MAKTTIGTLKYDVVADTSKFSKDMAGTKKEIKATTKALKAARTPAERYAREHKKLLDLKRRGLITNKQYTRSLNRERAAMKRNKVAARNLAREKARLNKMAMAGGVGGAVAAAVGVGMVAMMAVVAGAAAVMRQVKDINERAKTDPTQFTQEELKRLKELNAATNRMKKAWMELADDLTFTVMPALTYLADMATWTAEALKTIPAAWQKTQESIAEQMFKWWTGGTSEDFRRNTAPAAGSAPPRPPEAPRPPLGPDASDTEYKKTGEEIAKAMRAPGMPPLAVRSSREEYAALARIRSEAESKEQRRFNLAQEQRKKAADALAKLADNLEPAIGV